MPPVKASDDQAKPDGNGPGPTSSQTTGRDQASNNGSSNGHQAHGQQQSNGDQQNGAQYQESPPGFVPPYRGIPGYYSYGAYPGGQYDPAVQDQYLYQYNYDGLHPYWRNAYMRDEDESWDEQNPNE